LDHLISVYEKPIVTVMDGTVMGGGVGISLPARYRIATERTRFAMPETGIGLFPDVGAGWCLPRLPGGAGAWLAYTGGRLGAIDCLGLGIATHFIASADLPSFKAALTGGDAAQGVASHVREAASDVAPMDRDLVESFFAKPSLDDVLAALGGATSDWAQAQLASIRAKSPTSLKVTERLFRLGAQAATLAEDLAIEYRLASRIALAPDFREGVRAAIVDKDNAPRWSPPSLADVTEAMVDAFFAPLPAGEEWTPLPDA